MRELKTKKDREQARRAAGLISEAAQLIDIYFADQKMATELNLYADKLYSQARE